MSTGTNDERGYVPPEPNITSLLGKMMGGGGGWSQLNSSPAGKQLEDQNEKAAAKQKLQSRYYAMAVEYHDVMEDLLGKTLRCAPCNPALDSLDKMTAFALERQGQNGVMTYILKMVHLGKGKPKSATASKSKKKK